MAPERGQVQVHAQVPVRAQELVPVQARGLGPEPVQASAPELVPMPHNRTRCTNSPQWKFPPGKADIPRSWTTGCHRK